MKNKLIDKIIKEFDSHYIYRNSFIGNNYGFCVEYVRKNKKYSYTGMIMIITKDMKKRARKIIDFIEKNKEIK